MKLPALLIAIGVMTLGVTAQPLANPFAFNFGPDVRIDTSMLPAVEPAGAKGRVSVSSDGHFVTPDGERIRFFGVTMQYTACMPDSITAIETALRLRALGVNAVRFNAFDLSLYPWASIFAVGTTTSALDAERMRRFDWFIYQLKRQGIYTVLTFHSTWQPLADDGVRQADSVGWGTRIPIFFDPVVQQLHRRIMRMVLEHVNPFTATAYKDETAIPYIIAVEDASLVAYWMYSADITRPNQYGTANVGSQHLLLIDSLFNAYVRSKGLGTDAALNAAWKTTVQSSGNLLRNGGFEDPFDAAWVLGVGTTNGAQAVGQFSDADKKEGSTSYRIRIGKLSTTKSVYEIYVSQGISPLQRHRRYRCSFWARTTPQKVQRDMLVLVYNGTYPYNNYGLNKIVTLTAAWQQYDYVFTSTATDEATALIGFMCGQDTGDVYLDDVKVVEEPFPGLLPGESIAQSSVKRSSFWDDGISPARAKDIADFYRTSLTSLFDGVRKLVRDSLDSDVLLCPSSRTFTHLEQIAGAEYDVTSSTEWRTSQTPILAETGGGSVASHAQTKITGKPHVVSHASIQFPRPYQDEMMSFIPSYAGLQDWDAVFPGIYSSSSVMASPRIDSAVVWELFNKPNILALMPFVSQRFLRGDVGPSPKTITINVGQEALDLPRVRAVNPYSLSVYTDNRMPVFRTVTTNLPISEQESFLPHREISALTDDVDLRALDAENEQIYWDATAGVQRVVTPASVSATGRLAGELIELGDVRVEQLDAVPHATVALTSLDTLPLDGTSRALLVVSTRVLNEGASWNAQVTELATWGAGNAHMEGTSMRLTVPGGGADSCIVQPLGASGLPSGAPVIAAKGSGGRFSFVVNTKPAGTPWFSVRFARTPTSVGDDALSHLRVTHDAAAHRVHIEHPDLERVDLVDIGGRVLLTVVGPTVTADVDLRDLASGAYVVRIVMRDRVWAEPLLHVR